MSNKSVPLSVRLSPTEANFVAALKIEDADTPSEKLRAIISAARKRRLGTEDFGSALALAQESISPTMQIVKTNQNDLSMHSELISRIGDWLPECIAYFSACNGSSMALTEEELREIEKNLINRVSVLMQSVLQMAITSNGPVYDAEHLKTSLQPVIELASIIGERNSAQRVSA